MLPVTDQLVTQLRIDYGFTVLTENDGQIRVEGPFVFRTSGGDRLKIGPGDDPTLLAPLLMLARSRIERGLASEDGRLELHFREGQILVPSSTNFEPWQLAHPDGLLVVSTPSEELAVWTAGKRGD